VYRGGEVEILRPMTIAAFQCRLVVVIYTNRAIGGGHKHLTAWGGGDMLPLRRCSDAPGVTIALLPLLAICGRTIQQNALPGLTRPGRALVFVDRVLSTRSRSYTPQCSWGSETFLISHH
jgi:hypothetical protein